MNNPTFAMENVHKSYDSGSELIRVLRDVDLSAAPGDSVAIVGASGSGKSTLLNLLGGLDRADSGHIRSCGYQVSDLGEAGLTDYRSRGVGFIFQFHYLLKDFTALENVMLPALMSGTSRSHAKQAAMELLERVRVKDRASHYPVQLSGGERQRVALGRALINNPSLILADEPTGNLDEDHKTLVADLLFSLSAQSGLTLVLATHARDLAERADRTLCLVDGHLAPV